MNMINIMWCVKVKCDVGEWIGPPGSISNVSGNSAVWGAPVSPCSPCNFSMHAQNCPAALQMELCGNAVTHSLLAYDPSVPCSEVNLFYKLAVLVILLSYTVAYPIFLVVVADRGSKILEREYPLDKRLMDEFTEKELYYEKARKSANVSAPVYQAYRRSYRKARLTFLLQRVFLVTIGCLTSRGIKDDLSWIGLALVLLVCMAYFLYTVLLHPYARPVENIYGATQQFTIACVASVGVVGQRLGRRAIPFGVAVLLAVIMVVAPLAALTVGLVRTFRQDRERAERLQRRLQEGFAVVRKAPQASSTSNAGGDDALPGLVGESVESWKGGGGKASGGGAARAARRERQDRGSNSSRKLRLSNSRGSGSGTHAAKPPPAREVCEADAGSFAGPRQHCSQKGSCSLQGRSAHGVNLADPTAEEQPMELTPHPGDAGVARAAPSASQQSPAAEVSYGFEFPEDDYFKDARRFIPAVYFAGFDDLLLLLSGDAAKKEAERQRLLHAEETGKWSVEGTLRNFFSFFSTLRGQLVPRNTTPGQKEPLVAGAEELQSTTPRGGTRNRKEEAAAAAAEAAVSGGQEGQKTTGDVKSHPTANAPRKSVFFRCWKRWRKALNIHDSSLQYADVLERRRKLRKSTGLRERPFWLEPSEAQQQTYNVPGSSSPSHCARENRAVASERNAAGEFTAFSRLKQRKNLHHPPIVLDRKRAHSFAGGPPSSSDEVEVLLSSSGRRTPDEHASAEHADPPKRTPPKTLVSLVDRGSEAAPTEFNEPQGQEGSVSMTARFECILNAERQVQRLEHLCQRELQTRYDGDRRPTVYAAVYPKVNLEGVDVTDWDEFMQQLLAEISYSEASSAGDSLSVSRRTGSECASESTSLREGVASGSPTLTPGGKGRKSRKETLGASVGHGAEADLRPLPIPSTAPSRVKLLLRHFVLRRRLSEVFKEQRTRLRALQQAVDFRIADTIKKYMQWFFLALSVCTTVALVLCLCGMLQGRKPDFVDGLWRDNSVERELMGHDSWESFTEHCCCLSRENLTATYPYYLLDVENWLCDDGRVKQRVRRDAYESTVVSGYSLRDLCGMTFYKGCHPFVTPDGRVELLGCSETVTEMEKKRW
ncbi:uncharacterized protein Tco025E_04588 [Trypanosoma conorhini]|uniref:Uncharacterized protein n=1 Tax=Trypanosoma conorhini TaxID=83891 RepID=A0A3R7NGF5_9TRYP|nr:uncharacterized protein Tco025E_04588 [Trypanosoma conorhini]RNF18203.1 hypothetical protein Tco025E_04588 [Trypanosoma conorhini]